MLRTSTVLLLLVFASLSSAALKHITPLELHQFFRDQYASLTLQKERIISVVAGVYYKNGTAVFQEGYGIKTASPDDPNRKASAKTVYCLGAISAAYTTTGILMVSEQHPTKFSIHKSANEYLGEAHIPRYIIGNSTSFQGYPVYTDVADVPDLTIFDLLTHYSGLDNAGTRGQFTELSLRRTLSDYLKYFGPRRIRDGDVGVWSSHGISYAAYATENTTGMRFYEYMRSQLADPLGLDSTFFGLTEEVVSNPNIQNWIYVTQNGTYEQGKLLGRQYYPAHDYYATVGDVAKFITFHINNCTTYNGTKLLSYENCNFIISKLFSNFGSDDVFVNLTKFTPGFGMGGWMRAARNNLITTELNSLSAHWHHFVKIYEDEDYFLIILSLGLAKDANFHRDVANRFQDTFLKVSNCTSDEALPDMLNMLNSSLAPGTRFGVTERAGTCYTFAVPGGGTLNVTSKLPGHYVTVDYSHTTWEKTRLTNFPNGGQRAFTKFLQLQTSDDLNILTSMSPEGAVEECYMLLSGYDHIFYTGVWDMENEMCLYPYPWSTDNLVRFVVEDEEVLYIVFGTDGGLMPFERTPYLAIVFNWEYIFVASFAGYGLLFLSCCITSSIILCDARHNSSSSIFLFDSFIIVTLSAYGSIANSILNVLALIGLVYFSGNGTTNETNALPLFLSSLAVLGFVFWMVVIAATAYLFQEKNEVQKTHYWTYLMLKITLILSIFAELIFLFITLQWNWFGPSKII